MRSRRPARRTAQTDDLPRLDPLVGFHQTFRQVAVVGLQPVVMADDHQVAVTAPVVLRDAYAAAEGGVNRVACLERQIHALMLAPASRTVFAARVHRTLIGAVVAGQRVDEVDHHRFGHFRHVDLLVGKERRRVPVFLENRAVFGHLAVEDVFPRIVAVQDHLHGVVFRGEGVEHGQAVGVENGLDLRGPETEAQRRHGIRRGLLRVDDRIGSGRLAFSRFIPLFGNGDEVLQRVDQRGLPRRHQAQRIGRGDFAGRRLCRPRVFGLAGRRGEDHREGDKGENVFFHSLFLIVA